jgi:hypothetical protein
MLGHNTRPAPSPYPPPQPNPAHIHSHAHMRTLQQHARTPSPTPSLTPTQTPAFTPLLLPHSTTLVSTVHWVSGRVRGHDKHQQRPAGLPQQRRPSQACWWTSPCPGWLGTRAPARRAPRQRRPLTGRRSACRNHPRTGLGAPCTAPRPLQWWWPARAAQGQGQAPRKKRKEKRVSGHVCQMEGCLPRRYTAYHTHTHTHGPQRGALQQQARGGWREWAKARSGRRARKTPDHTGNGEGGHDDPHKPQ